MVGLQHLQRKSTYKMSEILKMSILSRQTEASYQQLERGRIIIYYGDIIFELY